MIRLSRLADYAVLLMSYMAREPEGIHTALGMSSSTRVPVPTVSKILATLARAGLLESIRGRDGGYRLVLSPRTISVQQIISAVDGPIALTVCLENGGTPCDLENICPSQPNWRRINDALRNALDGVSLSEISTPVAVNLGPLASFQADMSDRT